jgi:hypothetical protein
MLISINKRRTPQNGPQSAQIAAPAARMPGKPTLRSTALPRANLRSAGDCDGELAALWHHITSIRQTAPASTREALVATLDHLEKNSLRTLQTQTSKRSRARADRQTRIAGLMASACRATL